MYNKQEREFIEWVKLEALNFLGMNYPKQVEPILNLLKKDKDQGILKMIRIVHDKTGKLHGYKSKIMQGVFEKLGYDNQGKRLLTDIAAEKKAITDQKAKEEALRFAEIKEKERKIQAFEELKKLL